MLSEKDEIKLVEEITLHKEHLPFSCNTDLSDPNLPPHKPISGSDGRDFCSVEVDSVFFPCIES